VRYRYHHEPLPASPIARSTFSPDYSASQVKPLFGAMVTISIVVMMQFVPEQRLGLKFDRCVFAQ
jgi:hypothetical protein